MTQKKMLYKVTITKDICVYAKDRQSAKKLALSAEKDEDADASLATVRDIKTKKDIPKGWAGGCIPYGSDDDATINDILTPKPLDVCDRIILQFGGKIMTMSRTGNKQFARFIDCQGNTIATCCIAGHDTAEQARTCLNDRFQRIAIDILSSEYEFK